MFAGVKCDNYGDNGYKELWRCVVLSGDTIYAKLSLKISHYTSPVMNNSTNLKIF